MPSTAIRDIDYDPGERTLDVTFVTSGKRYRYFDVSPEDYEALRNAFSKGSHFNWKIRPFHQFELIYEPPRHSPPPQAPFLRP